MYSDDVAVHGTTAAALKTMHTAGLLQQLHSISAPSVHTALQQWNVIHSNLVFPIFKSAQSNLRSGQSLVMEATLIHTAILGQELYFLFLINAIFLHGWVMCHNRYWIKICRLNNTSYLLCFLTLIISIWHY